MLGPRPLSAKPGTVCQWLPEMVFCADLEVCLPWPHALFQAL